jgi:uncharacterized protein YqgC (DUF456 family)
VTDLAADVLHFLGELILWLAGETLCALWPFLPSLLVIFVCGILTAAICFVLDLPKGSY